jgi:hypothetical protein
MNKQISAKTSLKAAQILIIKQIIVNFKEY